MKRLAVICTVLTGLLAVLGIVEAVTNYQWSAGDQDPLFGNPRLLMNDGTTVLIATGILAVGSVIMWVLALRKDRTDQHQS